MIKNYQQQGPYALMRNPVYASVILASIGFFILAGAGIAPQQFSFVPYLINVKGLYLNPVVIVLCIYFLISVIPHYLRKIKREEDRLLAAFGEDFTQYQKRVPARLIPYPAAFFRSDWIVFTFSTEAALKNRAFTRILKYGTWLILFLMKEAFIYDMHKHGSFQIWKYNYFLLYTAILILVIAIRKLSRKLQDKYESFQF
ncbi:MAG: hypothetical protein ABIH42_03935 [Planctomycetota bacterium]